MRQHPWSVLALLAAAACSGSGSERGRAEGGLSPIARSLRVEDATLVIEGRWQPVEAAGAPAPQNAVRAVCKRAEKLCREELTTLADGARPVTETFEYRIREWTKAKLVATRRAGTDEVSLRVSLTGLAAEKIVMGKNGEEDGGTRWRLE